MEQISVNDRQILRELAARQMGYAQTEAMRQLHRSWRLHNTFRGDRPMVHIEMGTFENEMIPPLVRCEGEEARRVEAQLYRGFLNHALFGDDTVVKDYYPVRPRMHMKLFGLETKRIETGGVGHQFVYQINDLEDDFPMLTVPSEYGFDREGTQKELDVANDLFGDILPAKLEGCCLSASPTQRVVHFMGMEKMLYAMYDYPDAFKKMMDLIADAFIGFFRFQEQNGLIRPTVDGERLWQGTWCFTDELPGWEEFAKRPFTTHDVWGYIDSQETVGISPQMFEEFIRPSYQRIAECYGLLSYGCCEPVHAIYDSFLSHLPHLRKVSISAWCDEEFMGERLRGKKTVYQRKPSANYLGVGKDLDEDAVRAHIGKTVAAAKGCTLEISQRDVYSVANNPDKVRRYVEIIRSCCGM